MSIKIFDAWRVKTTSISALVDLGKKVNEFHTWEYLSPELLDSVAFLAPSWPELYKAPRVLAAYDDQEFRYSALLGEYILTTLLDKNASSPTWVATKSDRDFLQWQLQDRLKNDRMYESLKEVPQKDWKAFLNVLSFVYEFIAKNQDPHLVFLEGEDGWTYVKGFDLSTAARKFLDETYENFEYTNQTEMGASFFSAEIKKKVENAGSEREAYEILLTAQDKRWEQWKKALRGDYSFRYAGLHFPIKQDGHMIFLLLKGMLQKYLKADVPPFKKEK